MNINDLLGKMNCNYDYAHEAVLVRKHKNLLVRAEDLWRGCNVNSHIWWEDVRAPSALGWGDHSSHVFWRESQQLLSRAVNLERKAQRLFRQIQAARAAACLSPLTHLEWVAVGDADGDECPIEGREHILKWNE